MQSLPHLRQPSEIALHFGIDSDLIMPEPERLPPPELFPTRSAFVVREDPGKRMLEVMSWGFPLPGANKLLLPTSATSSVRSSDRR